MKAVAFACTLLLSLAALAAPIATGTATDAGSFPQQILKLYKKEAQKPNSKLSALLKKINRSQDFPALGNLDLPSETDLFLISNGKSGPETHYQTFLLGIPSTRTGTGMIEQHAAHLRVEVSFDLENDASRITIASQVELKDKR